MHVVEIVLELLEVEPVAVGFAASVQVERVHGQPFGHELLGRPAVVPAVRLDAVTDDHDGARRSEERRVGKECRSRWSPYEYKKNETRSCKDRGRIHKQTT